MSDYDSLKNSGKLDEAYGSLKSTKEIVELTKDAPIISKEQYEKLADRFEEALKLIEMLRSKISELESKKMPTKDEVESMSAMLDVLNKLDIKTLDKINSIGRPSDDK